MKRVRQENMSLEFDAKEIEVRLIEFCIDLSDVLLFHLVDDNMGITWNDDFDHG